MIMFFVGHPTKGAFETYACGTGNLRGATPLWVAAYGANGFTGDAFNVSSVRPHFADSSADIIRALLAAGADQHLMTDDGTTPLMMAAGLGRATHTPGELRGVRSPSGEEAVRVLIEAGADVNAVNEADFTALHGAAFRGLNEIVQILVENGADINARATVSESGSIATGFAQLTQTMRTGGSSAASTSGPINGSGIERGAISSPREKERSNGPRRLK